MQKTYKSSGLALITGSMLMTVTMILHPAAGNFERLLKITPMIIASHSLAITAIPLMLYGFWGLTGYLQEEAGLATAGFITISVGMVAVMCAAATNGLALPFFISHYQEASEAVRESLKPIMHYNRALNHAFDYIYIGATCLAILLWSAAILKTRIFSKWIGWLGISLTIAAVVLLISGFVFVNLFGFRVFVFGILCWILSIAFSLQKIKPISK